MTTLKTLLATTALCTVATAATAGDYSNAGNYNAPIGMSSTSQNAPVNSSLRDANGNLVVENGAITSSSFSEVGGVQSFNPGSGSGVGGLNGSATAIGNQLNVVAAGNNDIVIVSSTQINNGNQTATTTVK
jgi:holdfast attachment protein HfaA